MHKNNIFTFQENTGDIRKVCQDYKSLSDLINNQAFSPFITSEDNTIGIIKI